MQKGKSLQTHILQPYEDENIIVHFIGDTTIYRLGEIASHTNPGYEICFIPSGKGFFRVGEQDFPMSSGQLFMTKEPQLHKGWASKDHSYRILYLCFKIKINTASTFWLDVHHRLTATEEPIALDINHLESLHLRIISEVLEKHEFTCEVVKRLMEAYILSILRNYEYAKVAAGGQKRHAIACSLSSLVFNYIALHITDKITLSTLSHALKFCPSYLCREFKKQTGFTLMEYYNFSRLEKAKAELESPAASISQIALKYNFSSIHHFSKAFKLLYGTSPRVYKLNV